MQPARDSSESVAGRFARVAARWPARPAVGGEAGEWTYAELDARSNGVAAQVLELAPAEEAPVALLLGHEAGMIAAILGVLKAGRMYLALDAADPPARSAARLADAGVRWLLHDAAHAAAARALARDGVDARACDLRPARLAPPEVSPAAGAWLMYTSGSTGGPKGVWQNHRGVVHHADVYAGLIGLTPEDRLTLLSAFHLAASATALFTALLHGAAVCPFSVRAQGVGRLASWLGRQRISVYHSVPTVFRHLWRQQQGRWPEALRVVRLGGEAVVRADLAAFGRCAPPQCRLLHALSSTETGLICAGWYEPAAPPPPGRVAVGPPVPGVEVDVVDEEGRPMAPGQSGRLRVRGEHLAQGYWRQPEATAAAFRPVTGQSAKREFLTGDLGRWRSDGWLEHLGRMDHQVKIRGQRVDLAEVEAALHATGLFEEAAAAAAGDATGEQRLIAHVVAADRAEAVPAHTARAALRQQGLPQALLPDDFVFCERLPRTAGGKIDRPALAAGAAGPVHRPRRGPPPAKGVESQVAAIWQEVLGVGDLRRDDDFFDLGGTSIQAVEVLARVERQFHLWLPPETLLQHGTLAALAAVVAGHVIRPARGSLVPLRSEGAGRPLFLIHSARGDVATYGQLVRRLRQRPIFGLQCPGLDGESAPLLSVPALARRYVREMIAADPAGPYFLGGARMGAKVALEAARQLVRAGRPVGLVALFNFTPPAHGRLYAGVVEPVRLARDAARRTWWTWRRALGRRHKERWLAAYRAFINKINCRLRNGHQPRFYPGALTLFTTPDENFHGRDPVRVMRRFARHTEVVLLAHPRAELFQHPAVLELARELDRCLEAAEHRCAP